MLREFGEFIKRGNVLDLAVAVIIGVAFGAIVTSFVNDIIMPIIGAILGGVDFTGLAIQVGEASIMYGNFIQAVLNFLIIAWVIFMIVRFAKRFDKEEPAPVPSAEVVLLTEIRDLLKTGR